jgi:hypothetical protein
MVEFLTGHPPFQVTEFNIPQCFQDPIDFRDAKISDELKELLRKMLKIDPK